MNYSEVLKQLSIKENISVTELENEMKKAINAAGLNCSVEDFIKQSVAILKRTIYSI